MSRKPRKSKSVQIAESIHRPGSGYARLLAFAISKGGRGITKAELEAYAAEIGQSKGSAGVILSPSLNNQGNWSGMGNLYFFESRKMKGTRECRYFFNLRAKALEKVRRPVKPIVETPSETGANERPPKARQATSMRLKHWQPPTQGNPPKPKSFLRKSLGPKASGQDYQTGGLLLSAFARTAHFN